MHILIVLTQTVSCITETYETAMGLIENGIQVSVILSKNIDKINESKFDFVIDTMVNYWDLFILNGIRSGKKIVYVHDPIAHSGANKFKQKWWEVQYKNAEQLIVHTEKLFLL